MAAATEFVWTRDSAPRFQWNWWVLLPLVLAFAATADTLFAHSRRPHWLGFGAWLRPGLPSAAGTLVLDFGGSVAVCSRCLGIYLGAAVGLPFRTKRNIVLRLLLAAAALNFLDAASELAGLHGNWLGARSALGLALGASAALLISSSISLSRITLRERPSHPQSSPQLSR